MRKATNEHLTLRDELSYAQQRLTRLRDRIAGLLDDQIDARTEALAWTELTCLGHVCTKAGLFALAHMGYDEAYATLEHMNSDEADQALDNLRRATGELEDDDDHEDE